MTHTPDPVNRLSEQQRAALFRDIDIFNCSLAAHKNNHAYFVNKVDSIIKKHVAEAKAGKP